MNDLGIDLETIVPASGFQVLFVREAEPADIEAVAYGPRGTAAPQIKRLSDRHHALARAIASGMKEMEAAVMLGYHHTRVSQLKQSPAFLELIEFYREKQDSAFVDFAERLAGFGQDVLQELQERIEDAPESFTVGQLSDLLKNVADRTGHAPVTKSASLNINVSLGEKLAEARRRFKELK